MNLKTKKLIPVAIFGGLILLAVLIKMNPPEAQQRGNFGGPQMVVETTTVEKQDYKVRLQSYGTVQPRTQSMLVAQVSGQIVSVNENVRDGGFFEKGDILGQIDPRDYEADVRISEASLADARQALAEAEARSNQALEDWERLGNTGDAPDLVLRVPQLEAAKARVSSAKSSLQKANLDLERAQIVAPFAGRILRKLVDVGQVVSPNTQLAEIYATDVVEIRLPIRNRDLGFIDLPERFRFADANGANNAAVTIHSDLIGNETWNAHLVRTESAIDEAARQLHVIAQIEDPFGPANVGRSPLKIGQYVTAEIEGSALSEVLVVPNSTIYQGSYVYIVEDDLLRRKDVVIAWQNDNDAIISDGIKDGDQLVTTALGQVTSGLRVAIAGAQRPNGGGPPGGGRPPSDGAGQ
ncbi:MAG: efflux RND transporter periplasmic adaptor subunit [Woeseia sp.]|jgi:RND family efflux transporter MFP subunit|nr:efflux RND transporter periplasmic adaptor subunit [Woeseia sp.]MBT6210868.1 efflux RND transporter periplasmic adaptor subunit [Woeseia sp.]